MKKPLFLLSVFLAVPFAQVVPLPNGDHVTLDSSPRVSVELSVIGKTATVTEVPCGIDSATSKHTCFPEFGSRKTVSDSAELASLKAKADANDTIVIVKVRK